MADSMNGWFDIATAPKLEFEVVLLGREGSRHGGGMPCFWDGENWKVATIFAQGQIYVDPTHWQPLPAPPASQTEEPRS